MILKVKNSKNLANVLAEVFEFRVLEVRPADVLDDLFLGNDVSAGCVDSLTSTDQGTLFHRSIVL